jgi:uncharacterized membrane protein
MAMSAAGVVHTAFALAAMGSGLVVIRRAKGTRLHRTVGWVYTASMLGLFTTAFLIYRLFGGFGPFHVAAVFGLATLAAGVASSFFKRPRRDWVERHYYLMSYSYLGLLAAAGAEIATRVPGAEFKLAATLASVAVIAVGAGVIAKKARSVLPHIRATHPGT